MSISKRSGLQPWAQKAIVTGEVAAAILSRVASHPADVLRTLCEQPALLVGVRPDTQLAMYRQLVARGMQSELAELAAKRETPARARALIADTVLPALLPRNPAPENGDAASGVAAPISSPPSAVKRKLMSSGMCLRSMS